MKKKIVAFAGSNSLNSINKQLVKFVAKHLGEYEVQLLDLNDFEMPIYSIDREEASGIPKEAMLFQKYLKESDAIVCSLAEHNRSYSVAFKNIFDWCSRSEAKVFDDKPMLLLSTSPGGYGGGNVMNTAKQFFPQFGAEIIETFSLPSFMENFKADDITEPGLKADLLSKIETFKNKL